MPQPSDPEKPRTLTVDPGEVHILQLALQGANANHPNHPGLATLTAKVAALSDLEPTEPTLSASEKK